jgi:hypothetical protein
MIVAGPKRRLPLPTTAKPTAARPSGRAAQVPAPPPAKRAKPMSVKDRLKKKLRI